MWFLWKAIEFCIEAHQNYPTHIEKAVRNWDKETPYAIHPLWCAMTFLEETNLIEYLESQRQNCVLALLFHDIKEDTTIDLPEWLPPQAVEIVDQMTFSGKEGSTAIEIKEIWGRPPIIRLLKLYDKVSNLLDGSWMSDEKWNGQYVPYVQRLADDVEVNYGQLNIVCIARAIAVPRRHKEG